jgi:hypothetical protein
LTDSNDSKQYVQKLKQREQEASGIELSTFCRQLKLKSEDNKEYETDCAGTEGIFRIIYLSKLLTIQILLNQADEI